MGKRCCSCKKKKDLSNFHARGSGHQSVCKPCKKALDAPRYQRDKEKVRRRAKERVDAIKDLVREMKSEPCTDCGGRFHFAAMGWDHLPGTEKSFDVANGVKWGYAVTRLLAEIEKCELVCANCHAVRTHGRHKGR